MAQGDRSIDRAIPPLWMLQGLAAAADVGRAEVANQYAVGLLPGLQVSSKLVVFREAALEQLRADPHPSRPKKDSRLPELVTTAWVAKRWARSSTAIDRLYGIGKLPGVVLGGFTLFRRELIEHLDIDELTPGPHAGAPPPPGKPQADPAIPKLFSREEAARSLELYPAQVRTWFHLGRIPGQVPTSVENASKVPMAFRAETIQRLDREQVTTSTPVRDPDIPDLVNGVQAAAMLGVDVGKVARMRLAGDLPGQLVRGKDGDTTRAVYRRVMVKRRARR